MKRDFLYALPVLLVVAGVLGWLRLQQPMPRVFAAESKATAENAGAANAAAENTGAEKADTPAGEPTGARPALRAELDLEPRAESNGIIPSGLGIVSAALIASADFDISAVNPLTLELARADGTGGAVAPISLDEVDWTGPRRKGRDGHKDLYLVFSKRALVRELGLDDRWTPSPLTLELRGNLLDGQSFVGRDELRLDGPAEALGEYVGR